MISLIMTGYIASFVFYALTLITCILELNRTSCFLSVTALGFNGLILAGILILSGQPSLFDVFSALLFTAFILGILGAVSCPTDERRLDVRACVWVEILFLFSITLLFPKEPLSYNFYYSYLWVVLFHGFRCLALSFALFSAAHFIRFRVEPDRRRVNNPFFRQGRNFLLLAALAFLCGEYAGMIWCQNGWGDFWHWKPTFFQSTLIILWFMFAFHVPGKNRRSDDFRSVIGIMTPFVMLTIKVVKGLL